MKGVTTTYKEYVQGALDAECLSRKCFGYCISLIRNARVKEYFQSFQDVAEYNFHCLTKYLSRVGQSDAESRQPYCVQCKLTPEDFSLYGAIELGIELTTASIQLYKRLLDKSENARDKEIFKDMLKEKIKQRNFLRHEQEFDHERKRSIIDDYCIPEILARLWR